MTDKEYEAARNALIPKALAKADKVAGKRPKDKKQHEEWANEWNRVYHETMNKLWRARK